MSTPKEIVIEWWNSGADFDTGVSLYVRFGNNKVLKNTMPGRKERYYEKLKYELCKSVGLDWKKMPRLRPAPKEVTVLKKVIRPAEHEDEQIPHDDQNYPPLVRKVIAEYSECYRERSKLHWQMCEVPSENSKENCETRSKLLSSIKKLTIRMDELHFARQAYLDQKELPEEAKLWPKQLPPVPAASLPDDVEGLKRLKKHLQTSLVKDRNLLDYQQKSKKEKKTPMPAGPKRMAIEKRIANKIRKIEQIEYKLVEFQ